MGLDRGCMFDSPPPWAAISTRGGEWGDRRVRYRGVNGYRVRYMVYQRG